MNKPYIEKIVQFSNNKRYGILTLPLKDFATQPIIIFLNAGLLSRIGPSRLYVTMAREFARQKMPSFRFDLPGIGDSLIGDETNNDIIEIRKVIDILEKRTGSSKFLLAGICSGGNYALKVAIDDHRVVGVCMVNSMLFDNIQLKQFPIKQIIKERYYKKNLFNKGKWIGLFRGRVFNKEKLATIFKLSISLVKASFNTNRTKIDSNVKEDKHFILDTEVWKFISTEKVEILCVLSEGSEAFDVFNYFSIEELLIKHQIGNVAVKKVFNADHLFVPAWSQVELINIIGGWLRKLQDQKNFRGII